MYARLLKVSLACFGFSAWSGDASGATRLLFAFDRQCAISMETQTRDATQESLLAALAPALLTSAASAAVDLGIVLVKTKLDPTQGEFSDTALVAVDGMYENLKPNIKQACMMVGVFDTDEIVSLPLRKDNRLFLRAADERAEFHERKIGERLPALFPSAGSPLLYFEAVRRFSPDGTAYWYQPVYAYIGRMIKPHWLSKDPVWQVTLTWRSLEDKPIAAWAYKLTGDPPFELDKTLLVGLSKGYVAWPKPNDETAKNGVASPFTVQVDVAEHRSATAFAIALQRAVTENEAAIKAAMRDAYPWRQAEVQGLARAANEQVETEARKRFDSYLTGLAAYRTSCAQPADDIGRAGCGATYTALKKEATALKGDIQRLGILPSGQVLPEPDPPGPVKPS